eukprot:598570-Rhodomonas_salina.2
MRSEEEEMEGGREGGREWGPLPFLHEPRKQKMRSGGEVGWRVERPKRVRRAGLCERHRVRSTRSETCVM